MAHLVIREEMAIWRRFRAQPKTRERCDDHDGGLLLRTMTRGRPRRRVYLSATFSSLKKARSMSSEGPASRGSAREKSAACESSW